MMGYTLPDQREIFDLNEMSESFDIKRMSLGGPIFDIAKLKWLNGRYLREKLNPEDVLQRMIEWKANPEFFAKILPLALKRLETLSDFFPLAQFLFNDAPEYTSESLLVKMEGAEVAKLLKIAEWELEKTTAWQRDKLSAIFQKIAVTEEIKLKQVLAPFFVAISGSSVSLPLFDSLELLGPDLTRTRIRFALDKLTADGFGLSKKGLKKLEKEYAIRYGNRVD
jgi:glutamyl-tRNA synthetase